MCSLHGCCDHGIHSDRNTPNWKQRPDRAANQSKGYGAAQQTIVSQPREVTRLNCRQSSRPGERSDRGHDRDRDRGRADTTLHSRSDSHLNARASPDATSTLKNVHVVISGKVQGVSYRRWAVENATKLSLNGWVRNCKDGTVEAVFSGKPNSVDHMLDKCKVGPSRARVATVAATPAAGPPKKGFEQLDDKRW